MWAARWAVSDPIPTCGMCQEWVYDPKTWKPVGHGGKAVKRQANNPPPCYACPKSGKEDGKPRPDRDPTERSQQAVEYYGLCQMDPTNIIPRDKLVIRNNAIIARVQQSLERGRGDLQTALLGLFAGTVKGMK